MITFEIYRNDMNEPFNKFIKRSINENFNGLIKGNIENLNEDILNNIFIKNQYEINIEKFDITKYRVQIYKINKNKNIKIKFGCELETCILTKCSDVNHLENLIKTKDVNYWLELVKSYIINKIFTNIQGNFIKKFKYGYIKTNPKSNNIDYIIDFKNKNIQKTDGFIDNSYKYLIFTRDSSLVCGDSLEKYELSENKITKEKINKESFHCEIITPILTNSDDLKILYTNLFKSNCFRGNESAAFHVNVSMLNKNNEPIYFSKGFLDCFLDLYEKYEDKNYDKYRPYGSVF